MTYVTHFFKVARKLKAEVVLQPLESCTTLDEITGLESLQESTQPSKEALVGLVQGMVEYTLLGLGFVKNAGSGVVDVPGGAERLSTFDNTDDRFNLLQSFSSVLGGDQASLVTVGQGPIRSTAVIDDLQHACKVGGSGEDFIPSIRHELVL